jgi:diguanylate cyclase (GGDEF)-like protein
MNYGLWRIAESVSRAPDIGESMPEDVSALFTVSVYVEAMLGLLLLFTWLQNTGVMATAWWGSAHLLRAGSITLFGMYGRLPDTVTIDVANAILLTSFAVTWTGTRLFAGRDVNFVAILAGAMTWLVACQLSEGTDSIGARAFLSAAIIAAYTWLAASELWRNDEGQLVARLPAMSLLLAHGALFLLRTPLGLLMPHPAGTERLFGSVWLIVLSSEALLFTIAIAFILMAIALERTAYFHKVASLIDPLTGVWNRRGLMMENDRLMKMASKQTEDVAVLLIELDDFKSINDRHGRAIGDHAVQLFVRAAKAAVRSCDYVGRLGGEEFAVVLYGASEDDAAQIAERISSTFAEHATVIAGQHVGATVSIGVVQHEGPMVALTELLWKADRALHRTKERGRNLIGFLTSDGLPGAANMTLNAS